MEGSHYVKILPSTEILKLIKKLLSDIYDTRALHYIQLSRSLSITCLFDFAIFIYGDCLISNNATGFVSILQIVCGMRHELLNAQIFRSGSLFNLYRDF